MEFTERGLLMGSIRQSMVGNGLGLSANTVIPVAIVMSWLYNFLDVAPGGKIGVLAIGQTRNQALPLSINGNR